MGETAHAYTRSWKTPAHAYALVKMSRRGEQGNSGSSQQSASDAEFRASFSLLPHVNNILASLSQSDHSAVEKTVGYTMR